MNVIAALSVGLFVALGVGRLVGIKVSIRVPRVDPGRRAERANWYAQTGTGMTPGQFWTGTIGLGLVALVLIGALAGSLAVGVVPALAAAVAPRAVLARKRHERLAELRGAWPDGLRDLVTSIAAGASVTQAVEALATNGPEPLRVAFARFGTLARMLGTGPALEVIREELADPTTDRVVEVLVLAHERGGAIVRTVLEDLARATTRDVRLAEDIHTEGLEMRINARSVLVLPWLVLVLLCVRPGPFRDFYASSRGAVVLVAGAVLSAIGLAVVRRLARVVEEPRVFGGRRRAAA